LINNDNGICHLQIDAIREDLEKARGKKSSGLLQLRRGRESVAALLKIHKLGIKSTIIEQKPARASK